MTKWIVIIILIFTTSCSSKMYQKNDTKITTTRTTSSLLDTTVDTYIKKEKLNYVFGDTLKMQNIYTPITPGVDTCVIDSAESNGLKVIASVRRYGNTFSTRITAIAKPKNVTNYITEERSTKKGVDSINTYATSEARNIGEVKRDSNTRILTAIILLPFILYFLFLLNRRKKDEQ